jgi:hypothetical protein
VTQKCKRDGSNSIEAIKNKNNIMVKKDGRVVVMVVKQIRLNN